MVRVLLHCALAPLPWWLKNPVYRTVFGYRIGRRVRIGLSPILARTAQIGDGVRIGHGNAFWHVEDLVIEEHVRIGCFNLFRGGERIHIAKYAEILRTNVVNSIREPDVETETRPCFYLGAGSIVTTGHWIDFTDQVEIGARSILGGRNSSIWTHSRNWTRPVVIGNHVYLGSEVRLAPGARLPPRSVIGLGSVVIDALTESGMLIAGNPARPVKRLDEHNLRLLKQKTRRDLPDDVGVDLVIH